ncbi:MAG: hypothetical protein GY708_20775 [Actinomycetia bacterium]|nr:hypothetical protein [Actinomycetes bacterium]
MAMRRSNAVCYFGNAWLALICAITLIAMLVTAACSSGGDSPFVAGSTSQAAQPQSDDPAVADATEPTTGATTPEDVPQLVSGLAGWTDPITLPSPAGSSSVQDLVVVDETIFAVGSASVGEHRRGVAWRSSDTISWHEVDAAGLGDTLADGEEQWPTRIVAFDDKLIAIGWWRRVTEAGATDQNAIGWVSTDQGSTWVRIETFPATADYEYSVGLTATDGGVWATGYRIDGGFLDYRITRDGTVLGGEAPAELRDDVYSFVNSITWDSLVQPFVLHSDDGIQWDEIPVGNLIGAEFHTIATMPDGSLVAAGTDSGERVVVWRLGDDGQWSVLARAPLTADRVRVLQPWNDSLVIGLSGGAGGVLGADGSWFPLPQMTFGDLLDAGDRLVAVGWSQIEGSDEYNSWVAESLDAQNWMAVSLPAGQFPAAIASHGTTIVAAGSTRDAAGNAFPTAWLGGSTTETATGTVIETPAFEVSREPELPTADVLHYDRTSWTAVLVNDNLGDAQLIRDVDELGLDLAQDLVATADGSLWVATDLSGVFRLTEGNWTHFGPDDGLPSASVRRVVAEPNGGVVVATTAGIAVFDGERFTSAGFPSAASDTRAIDLVGNGEFVWAATPSGLVVWDGSTWALQGAADGLAPVEVVGGDPIAIGVARRLWPTDHGVVADIPGLGLAAWSDPGWTVLDMHESDFVFTVGRDGSVVFGTARDDAVYRWNSDGSVDPLATDVAVTSAAVDFEGTVWITSNLHGVYEVRDGSVRRHSSLAGQRLIYAGEVDAVGDLVMVRDPSGFYVRQDAQWTAFVDVAGLGYPLTSDSSFEDGAVNFVTEGLDGTAWALARLALSEWETDG